MHYRVFVASVLLVSSAPLFAEQPPLKQAGHWAQDYTGRKADPLVRFGTLPNGLRYAIMHNETPTDGVAMRMRIGAGSIEERDEEQGLAHFLEHMAFRGSTNVADGEVVHMLERQGLKFGPDTNAFTAQDETVYMFNFPKADQTALDTGLTLFREIGERLKLAPEAIDAERGVVLSEERLRDTPQYRMIKSSLSTVLDGTRVVTRWPIGTVDTIKAANHDRLSRFYRANYRPDNATLIIVGNIDPAAVEQQIRSKFSDWKPAGTPDPIDFGTPSGKKTCRRIRRCRRSRPARPDLGQRRRSPRRNRSGRSRKPPVKQVALTVLNQRLADRAAKPGSPYVGAQAVNVPSLLHSGGDHPDRPCGVAGEMARSARRGQLAGADAPSRRRSAGRAAAGGHHPPHPAPGQGGAGVYAQVARHCRRDRQGDERRRPFYKRCPGPRFRDAAPSQSDAGRSRRIAQGAVRQGQPDPVPLGAARCRRRNPARLCIERRLLAQPRRAGEGSRDRLAVHQSSASRAPSFRRRVDAKLGTTTVRFANGTRLLVKPTKFEKDKIQVSVSFGSGRAGVKPELAHSLWEAQLYPLGRHREAARSATLRSGPKRPARSPRSAWTRACAPSCLRAQLGLPI